MRMASLMRLHREETYQIPNPSPEIIIRAESARRTLVRQTLPQESPKEVTNSYPVDAS